MSEATSGTRATRPQRAGRGVSNTSDPGDSLGRAFAGLFGLYLAIGLLKFGNPVILDRLVETPRTFDEWSVFAWPIRLAYWGLLPIAVLGAAVAWRDLRPRGPLVLLLLLGLWLGWQFLSTVSSIDRQTSREVVLHFTGCVVCFALGHWALARVSETRVFWLCLMGGLIGVLGVALDQRMGGLEATRKMIFENTRGMELPPEYLARIQSNRVFSTLVYPNALAGALLLTVPPALLAVAQLGARWGRTGQRVCAWGLLAVSAAVLVWSGSKTGWLLATGMAVVALFHTPFSLRTRIGVALGLVAAGLVAFALLYGQRLSRGATSVSARVEYWKAAVHGFKERPLLGNGPGAFKKVYSRVRPAGAEMAQLAHNDYLQQAVDSGIVGFLAYLGFVGGSLVYLYRSRRSLPGPFAYAALIGVAAWFLHGCMEFGLYIPATAWLAFAVLGWLLALPPSRNAA